MIVAAASVLSMALSVVQAHQAPAQRSRSSEPQPVPEEIRDVALAAGETIILPLRPEDVRKSVARLQLADPGVAEMLVLVHADAVEAMRGARAAFEREAIRADLPIRGRQRETEMWADARGKRDAVLMKLFDDVAAVLATSSIAVDSAAVNSLRGRVMICYWRGLQPVPTNVLRDPPDLRAIVGALTLRSDQRASDDLVIGALSTGQDLPEASRRCRRILDNYEEGIGSAAGALLCRQSTLISSPALSKVRADAYERARWEGVCSARGATEQLAAVVGECFGEAAAVELEAVVQEAVWPALFGDINASAEHPEGLPPMWRNCSTDAARRALRQLRRVILDRTSAWIKSGHEPLAPHGDYLPAERDEFQVGVLEAEAAFRARHFLRDRGSSDRPRQDPN